MNKRYLLAAAVALVAGVWIAGLTSSRWMPAPPPRPLTLPTPAATSGVRQPTPPPAPVSVATPTAAPTPMEILLATIDKRAPVRDDDLTVKRFRFLLGSIERKTKNTKTQIGDMTVNAQQQLRDKYGKEKSLLELMEGANRAIPDGSNHWDYAEIISMLIILEGQS